LKTKQVVKIARLTSYKTSNKRTVFAGTTAVVINTSRLALISAAKKACTFRVVVLLQSATETGHLSGRQGVGVVERARWSGVQ